MSSLREAIKIVSLHTMYTCLYLTRPYTLEVLGQEECGSVGFSEGPDLFSRNGNIAFISWVIEDEWPYVGGRSMRTGLKCAIQSLHTVDSLPLNHLIAVPLIGFMNLRSQKCSLKRRNTRSGRWRGRRNPTQCL